MLIFSIRTAQSSLGDDGGDTMETLPPPAIVVVSPWKLPVLGLYQRFVKVPDAPERLSVPVLLAFGRWTAYISPRLASTTPSMAYIGTVYLDSPLSRWWLGTMSPTGIWSMKFSAWRV